MKALSSPHPRFTTQNYYSNFIIVHQKASLKGGSPGLVDMGDDSCLRGCGFKSQHHILDGHDIFNIDLL